MLPGENGELPKKLRHLVFLRMRVYYVLSYDYLCVTEAFHITNSNNSFHNSFRTRYFAFSRSPISTHFKAFKAFMQISWILKSNMWINNCQVKEAMDFFAVRFNMHQSVYTHKCVKAIEFMVRMHSTPHRTIPYQTTKNSCIHELFNLNQPPYIMQSSLFLSHFASSKFSLFLQLTDALVLANDHIFITGSITPKYPTGRCTQYPTLSMYMCSSQILFCKIHVLLDKVQFYGGKLEFY